MSRPVSKTKEALYASDLISIAYEDTLTDLSNYRTSTQDNATISISILNSKTQSLIPACIQIPRHTESRTQTTHNPKPDLSHARLRRILQHPSQPTRANE